MKRIAINGFGRIGRAFVRVLLASDKKQEMEVVAINDLTTPENLAYLLTHDSVYGHAKFPVAVENGNLVIDGKPVALTHEKDPAVLPWKAMNIDVVVESTGHFTEAEKAQAHITAGAKRVVISAPAKGEGVDTILIGANEEKFASSTPVTSNASCTTNAVSPIIGILDAAIGIERAVLNTTHAYTASQSIVDAPNPKDMREGRDAALNMVPASTGAAKATSLAYPQMKAKFDGIAVRVPVPAGSIADVTFVPKRPTTVEEVNDVLRKAAADPRWQRVFSVSEEQLVSSDILGLPYGSIADLAMTRVVDGMLVKVLAWYDNEMGYTHTLVEHVAEVAKRV